MEKKKNSILSKILMIFGILFILLVVLFLLFGEVKDTPEEPKKNTEAVKEEKPEKKEEPKEEATPEPTKEPTPEPTEEPTPEPTAEPIAEAEPQPNTSEMVDAILRKAKEDAQAEVTYDKAEEAFTAIYEAYPDFFTDNETMEKLMYYGAYLEYGFEDIHDGFHKLGMDTVQAIKYVYRGAETVDDVSTQENLKQIYDLITSAGIQ